MDAIAPINLHKSLVAPIDYTKNIVAAQDLTIFIQFIIDKLAVKNWAANEACTHSLKILNWTLIS